MQYKILGTLLILIYGFCSRSFAQIEHSFSLRATNSDFGYYEDLDVNSQGLIFTTQKNMGIIGFRVDHETKTFHREIFGPVDGEAYTIAIDDDDTIFVAYKNGDLRAYQYEGGIFTTLASINMGLSSAGEPVDLHLTENGTLLALNGADGLSAYEFNGTDLIKTAHVQHANGDASRLFIALDGKIVLANGADGIRFYQYDGSRFSNVDHIATPSGEKAISISAGNNKSILFFATHERLYAYKRVSGVWTEQESWKGEGFMENAELVDLQFTGTRTLYAIDYKNGYFATFVYDQEDTDKFALLFREAKTNPYRMHVDGEQILLLEKSLEPIDLTVNEENYQSGYKGSAWASVQDSKGNIFLANGSDGIRVYKDEGGSELVNIAHNTTAINKPPSSVDIALGPDDTIFAANDQNGVAAYTFDGTKLNLESVRTVRYAYAGAKNIAVGGPNNYVYVSYSYTTGVYVYSYYNSGKSNYFTEVGYLDLDYRVFDIAVTDDGTLLLGSNGRGLRAYSFDGEDFYELDNILNGRDVGVIRQDNRGTIFISSNNRYIDAYTFKDGEFKFLDDLSLYGTGYVGVSDIAVFPNGRLVFGIGGLGVHHFDGKRFADEEVYIAKGGIRGNLTITNDGNILSSSIWSNLKLFEYQSSGEFYGGKLFNGQTVSIAGLDSNQVAYILETPKGFYNLNLALSEMQGDMDVYVRFGATPDIENNLWDCQLGSITTSLICRDELVPNQVGTYHVLVVHRSQYTQGNLTATYDMESQGEALVHQKPVDVTAVVGSEIHYTFTVPDGVDILDITLNNLEGDQDLYVRYGQAPNLQTGEWDCYSNGALGEVDYCNEYTLGSQAGTYHIVVTGKSHVTGVTHGRLSASYISETQDSLLNNAEPVNIIKRDNSQSLYTLEIAREVRAFNVQLDSSIGDLDLYVRYGQEPNLDTGEWDCYSDNSAQQSDQCDIEQLGSKAGTYYILVTGNGRVSRGQLLASYEIKPLGGEIFNGQEILLPNLNTGEAANYYLQVSEGVDNITIEIIAGDNAVGDADLYVAYDYEPTVDRFDCVSYDVGNDEKCLISPAQVGRYNILVDAYERFSDVKLRVTYDQ